MSEIKEVSQVILRDTEDYILTIGNLETGELLDRDVYEQAKKELLVGTVVAPSDTYLIVNKSTGVIESHSPLLPVVIKQMEEMQISLSNVDFYVDSVKEKVTKAVAQGIGTAFPPPKIN